MALGGENLSGYCYANIQGELVQEHQESGLCSWEKFLPAPEVYGERQAAPPLKVEFLIGWHWAGNIYLAIAISISK